MSAICPECGTVSHEQTDYHGCNICGHHWRVESDRSTESASDAIIRLNPHSSDFNDGFKQLSWAVGFSYAVTHPDTESAESVLDAEVVTQTTIDGFRAGREWQSKQPASYPSPETSN